MSEKRDDLVAKLIELRNQEKAIRKELDSLDYSERLSAAKKYVGKYFRDYDGRDKEYVRCLFVHGIDTESCDPMCILVSYYDNIQSQYFTIESYSHFNPEKWEEHGDKWIEIKEEEYIKHYIEVQKRFSSFVNIKK
jgi:hypothetical protein